MTRDEIIRMGIDSGLYGGDPSTVSAGSILVTRLKRFYDLAVAAEREACAQICESGPERQDGGGIYRVDHLSCANAIRARGQQ